MSDQTQQVPLASPAEPPPVAQPVWPVVVGLLAAASAALVGGALFIGIVAGWRAAKGQEVDFESLPLEPWILLGAGVISVAAYGSFAFLAPKIGGEPWGARLRAGPSGASALELGLGALSVLAVGSAAGSTTWLLGWYQSSNLAAMDAAVPSYPGPAFILLFLFGSFGAGFAEELFFRGFVQTRLALRYGRLWAILVTSAVFGLYHFDPVHALLAAPLGLVFGWLTELRGSIRPAIFAHVVNNAVAFLAMRYLPTPPEAHPTLLAVSVLAAAVGLGGLAIIHRQTTPRVG